MTVRQISTPTQSIATQPTQQSIDRGNALTDAILNKLNQIDGMIERIDTSMAQSDASVIRQNAYIPGPCERIGQIFAAMLRYLGLIR